MSLDPAEYRRLTELAREDEREPWQQARWLLRRAIAEHQASEPQTQSAEAARCPA